MIAPLSLALAATWLPLGAAAPLLPHHPHDICNDVALTPDFPADPTVFLASAGSMNLFLVSKNRGFTWVNTRSGMRGWKILQTAVAPDWRTSRTVYVALGGGGMQRSEDGGATWGPQLVQEPVNRVVAGPASASERVLFFSNENTVWRSTDGGDTSEVIVSSTNFVTSLGISPTYAEEPALAYGGRDASLSVSLDGGESWQRTQLESVAMGVTFSPRFAQDRTLWIATWPGGVLRSTDGGASFEHLAELEVANVNDVVVAPTWPECKDVFAATKDDGVFRSRDGGDSWEKTSLRIMKTAQTNNHYVELEISPAYPEDPTLYCAAYEGLYVTGDAGENWYEHNVNPTNIGRVIEVSDQFEEDGTVFGIGYGNPLFVSSDRGVTWDMRSVGIDSMSTYSIGASPQFATDGLLMIGVKLGVRRSTDRGKSWESIELPPEEEFTEGDAYEIRQFCFAPDFETSREVFAASSGGLYHSTDAGKTWEGRDLPEDWTKRVQVSPDWPADRTILIGGWSLRTSTDAGETWSEPLGDGEITAIRFAPDFGSSGEVYAISRDHGFLRSTDRGASFELDADAFDGFSPSQMRLSPAFLEDGTIYVATLAGGIQVSTDRGRTWERMLPLGSPVDTCFDFALSPQYPADGTAFMCVFEGILATRDFGETWNLVTGTTIYDDDRDPWIYRGDGWTGGGPAPHFNYGSHMCKQAGNSASFPFTGTGITLYGPTGPNGGQAEILLDGELVEVIDTYAETDRSQSVLFETHDLPWAFHDLTVNVLGRRSERSKQTWVGIDAAVVDFLGPNDVDVPVLAKLENIYLTEDASYGRDTLGEPKEKSLRGGGRGRDRVLGLDRNLVLGGLFGLAAAAIFLRTRARARAA